MYTLIKYSAPGWAVTLDSYEKLHQEIYNFLCHDCRKDSDDIDSMLSTECGLELGLGKGTIGHNFSDILTEEEQLEEDIRKNVVKNKIELCHDKDMDVMPFQYRVNMKTRIRDKMFSKMKKSRHDCLQLKDTD